MNRLDARPLEAAGSFLSEARRRAGSSLLAGFA
jgi:hypothetical protein